MCLDPKRPSDNSLCCIANRVKFKKNVHLSLAVDLKFEMRPDDIQSFIKLGLPKKEAVLSYQTVIAYSRFSVPDYPLVV